MTVVTVTFAQMAWPHCGNFEYFDSIIGLYNVDKESVLNMFKFQLKVLWGTSVCQQYVRWCLRRPHEILMST